MLLSSNFVYIGRGAYVVYTHLGFVHIVMVQLNTVLTNVGGFKWIDKRRKTYLEIHSCQNDF